MEINPQIFREYDIRGVVEKDLTPDVARRLGQGFGTYMAGRGDEELGVGRDGRLCPRGLAEGVTGETGAGFAYRWAWRGRWGSRGRERRTPPSKCLRGGRSGG